MAFKLDPAKVEKGQYSEKEMKLVGNSEGSCCDVKTFEFDLRAPKIQQQKVDHEGLITVTFN